MTFKNGSFRRYLFFGPINQNKIIHNTIMWKHPSIDWRDLNSRPFDHESPPLTNGPGLMYWISKSKNQPSNKIKSKYMKSLQMARHHHNHHHCCSYIKEMSKFCKVWIDFDWFFRTLPFSGDDAFRSPTNIFFYVFGGNWFSGNFGFNTTR